jgi:nicotinate-nucleotide pyrophosphorylase (carboxylating)
MQDQAWITQVVEQALREDIGSGDCSARLIAPEQQASATIICREEAIMCGRAWLEAVFTQLDANTSITWHVTEGQQLAPNTLICELRGLAHILLTGERTALNFLQTLMGTATTTAQYVHALSASKTQLLDTRKTIPGLRLAQKYATRIGGAVNHRMGLYDAIMIKENHIMAAGSLEAAISQAKTHYPHTFIEVEVETLDELTQALALPIDRIMLDNFAIADIKKAVTLTQGRIPLEVSGNVALQDLAALGDTGVDYISIGALTKHLRAIDLSMRFQIGL